MSHPPPIRYDPVKISTTYLQKIKKTLPHHIDKGVEKPYKYRVIAVVPRLKYEYGQHGYKEERETD
jgi:hypothetical protein